MMYFENQFYKGFIASMKHYEIFKMIIFIMEKGNRREIPCFVGKDPKQVIPAFRERFYLNKRSFELEVIAT